MNSELWTVILTKFCMANRYGVGVELTADEVKELYQETILKIKFTPKGLIVESSEESM